MGRIHVWELTMKRRYSFRVNLSVPNGLTDTEVKDYVRSAVKWWCKSTDPDEPLFYVDRVTVTPVKEPHGRKKKK